MITVVKAKTNISGLNHEYPSSPQYRVSEIAAPVETVAIPNITSTIDGRQHIEAIIEEPATTFQRERGFSSLPSCDESSLSMTILDDFTTKRIVLFNH